MLINELLNKLINFDDLIFDLDDTIYQKIIFDIGAYEDIADYFSTFTLRKNLGIKEFFLKRRLKKGNDYQSLFNDAKSYYNLPNDSVKQMVDIYRSHNGRYLNYKESLIPYIANNLKHNQRVFIITNGNKRVQKIKIEKLKIKIIATGIVICNPNDPEKLKPSKWAFDILDKKYLLKKTVMVGDRKDIDGQFAINSGIPFIKYIYEN